MKTACLKTVPVSTEHIYIEPIKVVAQEEVQTNVLALHLRLAAIMAGLQSDAGTASVT